MSLRSPITGLASARLRTQLMFTYALVLVIDVLTFAVTVDLITPLGENRPPLIPTAAAMHQ
jgi:hypothetical protein